MENIDSMIAQRYFVFFLFGFFVIIIGMSISIFMSTKIVNPIEKLTNVAKASLEELKIDYEDYLRVRNKVKWEKGHPRYLKTRQYAQSEQLYLQYPSILPKCSDEEMANLCLTLIHQSSYMLQHLIEKQQEKYLKEGGVREQMKQARLQARC